MHVKSRVMGPLLAFVFLCFRQNIVTCKIVSVLYSLACLEDILLINVGLIVFIFGKHILKLRPFEKRAIYDPFFTFFSHQEKDRKIPSAHILLT